MLSQHAARAGISGVHRSPTPPPALVDWLARADVRIDGGRPWDIQVRDARLYRRLFAQGSLGAGESYMDGDWDCERIDELFARLLRADLDKHTPGASRWAMLRERLRHGLFNLQSHRRAFQVAERHYDIGNDVFEAMLDSRMVYSCAYWERADTLEQAQRDKLELICRKLELRRGERLLDIGCGWGALARHAAEHHGARVTGITVSRAQLELARRRCEGLDVDLQLLDWRQLAGRFDKIVSVGMFEHVGQKNYPAYFATVQRLLDDDGLFLLHTIGLDGASHATDAWIDTYIFPNGKLPGATQVTAALEGRFVIEDWHNFGADYDRTLMCWHANFERAWPQLAAHYDERFRRMWRYYLLVCAGFFRARQGQLWQLVLAGRQRSKAYRSVR